MESEREFKTKSEHWTLIINYLEMYPSLLRNKFLHKDGDNARNKKYWTELANQLNSLGYGRKTVDKWQLALGRWKSKVKAKATNIRLEMKRTGGGPAKTAPLTNVEERLISLMGWKFVTGDLNKELGLEAIELETNIPSADQEMPPSVVQEMQPSTVQEIQPPEFPLTGPSNSPPPLELYSKQKKTPFTKRKVPKNTESSKKNVGLAKMHNDNIEILKNINSNLETIANVMQQILATMQQYQNKG